MRNTVAILGIPIDELNTQQALQRLREFIESGRFHQVATANTDFLIKAMHDPELATILRQSDLVVPDGMPVVAASRWLKTGLPERVTGADLVPLLATLAAKEGYRVYMLGAKPEIAKAAKAKMEAANPGLQIVGCVSPPIGHVVEMDNEGILADIERANPHILLVAFGNPKQEKWIYMHRDRLKVPVCIGVGGTFDFIAGATKRAPGWMQKSGLEWTHRLAHEPRRLWKRYSQDGVHFSRAIAGQLWAIGGKGRAEEARLSDARVNDCTIISVNGALSRKALPEFHFLADNAINAGTHAVVVLLAASHIDSAALGTLINLHKRASHVGREIRLVAYRKRLRRALHAARASDLFKIYETVPDALVGRDPEELRVRLMVYEGAAVLVARGRADRSGVPAICEQFAEVPKSVTSIDIDMRGVSYIDCGMLAALRKAANNAKENGIEIRIAPSRAVERALSREKLQSVFTLVRLPRALAVTT
jgi:N-acetylglucosaminyldiphosphoundecaprenol N-acetyl-beta-D-mannosaminyltransferase